MSGLSQTVDGLSQLILDLDPARTSWSRLADRARDRIEELTRELQRVRADLRQRMEREGASTTHARLDAALERAASTLAEVRQALSERVDQARGRALYARLAQSYEDLRRLVNALPQPVPAASAPRISRTNLSRSAFHALSGLFAALLYHFVLSQGSAVAVMTVVVAVFGGLELFRRRSAGLNDVLMRNPFIRVIARPHEYYRVNSATYFAIGLLVAAIFCDAVAVELGCVILAIADPLASTIGRRFGTAKLFRDKSWVGTGTFFVAGALSALAYLAVFHPEVPAPLYVALLAGAVGALAEVFTLRLDDNLTIPLATALALTPFV